MPCLAIGPPFHNSKISSLKTEYITHNYLILWKIIQFTTLTMKIGHCLIDFPFKYNVIYLNDTLDHKLSEHKSVTLFAH